MPAIASKAYQWSDKPCGETLFDCLMFVSPLILITDCTYNTYRDVAGASLSLVLIFAGLSAWYFWYLSSRRKFEMDTETLTVRRYVAFVIPISHRQYRKMEIADTEVSETRGVMTSGCCTLILRLKDGSGLTVCRNSDRSELYRITARL